MKIPRLRAYTPLLIVTAFSIVIKAYDPVRSPVISALDPWGWVALARQFLGSHELDHLFTQTGYPPTFMYVVAAVSSLGVDPYDVVRYIPVVTGLNIIPIYLLMLDIFRSHRISTLASMLAVTSRFYFMRTAIGIPEGLSHFFFVFMLLFMLRALTRNRWVYRVLAAIFLAISVLYYHFTLLILVPLLAALPFAIGLPRRDAGKVLVTIVVPALLFSGFVWYFRVLPEMIQAYLGSRIYTYQLPVFERSFVGYLHILAYSVGKSGVVTLSELGYVTTLLAFLGVVAVLVSRRVGKERTIGINLLLTYLIVLVFLALALRIVYNLGVAGAGDSTVYVFSWLAMPAGGFASRATIAASDRLEHSLADMFQGMSNTNISKATAVTLIMLLSIASLSAVNYYKAPTGDGLGILQSHYYYKCLTDEEYFALQYVRYNTPKDSVVLVVGVEEPMLTYQAMVAQRTIVSIWNATFAGGKLTLSVVIMYPNLHSVNLTRVEIKLNAQDQQGIYFATGIRRVNLQVARSDGPPPPSKTLLEESLINRVTNFTQYDRFYQNDQVAVLQVFSAHLYY